MTIHLRSVTDERGDAVEYLWFCSQGCYAASFEVIGINREYVEEGGAYPCGAEHDTADYCETCGAPIGNPLTPDGMDYVREYVHSVLGNDPEDEPANNIARANELMRIYPELFRDDWRMSE